MRSLLVAVAAALLVLAGTGRASASASRQAEEYFRVRDKALHLVESFSLQEVQTQPERFDGKLLELRGMINGVGGSDSQTTLLIGSGQGTGVVMVVLPPEKRLTDWPFLEAGNSVRALCRVVRLDGSSTGSLEVVVPVKEYDAAGVEDARAKAARAKKQEAERLAALKQRQEKTRLSSRGVGAATVRTVTRPAQRWTHDQLVEAYAGAVRYFNRRTPPDDARRIAATIIDYSRRYGLDARLVMAVIAVESNFNPHAVSPKGAMGLGQLMPGTASGLGVANAYDVGQNLEGSTRLLRNHIRNFTSDGHPTEEAIRLALACYNAGAGAVKKYRGIPPYRETQNYVKKITRLYRQLKGEPV